MPRCWLFRFRSGYLCERRGAPSRRETVVPDTALFTGTPTVTRPRPAALPRSLTCDVTGGLALTSTMPGAARSRARGCAVRCSGAVAGRGTSAHAAGGAGARARHLGLQASAMGQEGWSGKFSFRVFLRGADRGSRGKRRHEDRRCGQLCSGFPWRRRDCGFASRTSGYHVCSATDDLRLKVARGRSRCLHGYGGGMQHLF